MTLGLDTSVVLRLLVGEPPGMVKATLQRLEAAAAAGDGVLVSDIVAIEAYHGLQFHYHVPKSRARELLWKMFASGRVSAERAETAQAFLGSKGSGPTDRLIHANYAARGARTLTFDQAQSRLPGAERLRPARGV